jgi:alkyldihydroxyacetonephosphate synthase
VITEVTFSLRPLPQARRGQAFHYADLAAGLEPIRLLVREGWRPPVVRLYDAAETSRLFPGCCPEGRALLLMLHEGPERGVEAEAADVESICRQSGGETVDAAVVDTWLEDRNHVPGFRTFLEKGIILDTIEVACTWDRAAELYLRAKQSLGEVPGILVASAHSSHSYRSGTNLYITFVARPEKREDMAATYRECWRRTMAVALEIGAGIAHHHGIGRVRRGVLAGEIGEAGVELLRSVKSALDPDGLLNPGVLLPDDSGDDPQR